jgi:hypothetical protein
VRTTEPRALPLAAFTLAAELQPAQQLARHPSGLIPLGWADDPVHPAPLALPPAPAGAHQRQPGSTHDQHQPLLLTAGGGSVRSSQVSASRGSPEHRSLPWGAAAGGAAGGGGSPGGALHQSLLCELNLPGIGGAQRYGRPASGSSTGGAGFVAGDESEPRPSPRGLRPYGSPGVSISDLRSELGAQQWSRDSGSGGVAVRQQTQFEQQQQAVQQQQQQQYWAAGEDESEDGGGRVQMGSPVRLAAAATAVQQQPADHAYGHAPSHHAPGSPMLPTLMGGPLSHSPPRHTVYTSPSAGAGVRTSHSPGSSHPYHPSDTLRDSLDTGRRAASAAAAAIANAEAAVMRRSGGGAGGGGYSGSVYGVRTPAGVAGLGGGGGGVGDPLRWSLRQSAQAAGGLSAALNAAASALHGPNEVGGSPHMYSTTSHGEYQQLTIGVVPGGVASSPPHHHYQHPQDRTSSAGAVGSVQQQALSGGWSGGDSAARELQEEVLRLRSEVRTFVFGAVGCEAVGRRNALHLRSNWHRQLFSPDPPCPQNS